MNEVNDMTHTEKAVNYFSKGFLCSQAVLAAFGNELGVTEEQALKLGVCFGSGMRKGEVCGACTGALMALGLMYGQTSVADTESRKNTNELTSRFLELFKEKNGSYICNDLLGYDMSDPEEAAKARAKGLFLEICPKMVASAVEVLERIMAE